MLTAVAACTALGLECSRRPYHGRYATAKPTMRPRTINSALAKLDDI